MADDDDAFVANEDEQWGDTDDGEEYDAFDVGDDKPMFEKSGIGAKTIFVTQQFRYFLDDYEVCNPIGEPGQFGIAYECYLRSDASRTPRCVKEINKARFHHIDSNARNDILRTMQNEIAILKQISHPNIVKLFDVYEDRHKLHLVMEFLPGGELFARICEKDSFSEKEAVRILKQILEALDHMHSKNILHLDLKPDNIVFSSKDEDAAIKLIDFGMARVVPRLAKLKDRVGTPNYMAPEVFSGNYSKAADIWSVGVIAFCMLFGFPPFYEDQDDIRLDEHSALEMKVKAGFEPQVKEGFGAWFPDSIPVSSHCRYLLSKMLETDVRKRWTAKECLSSVFVRKFEDASEKTVPPIVRDALRKFHTTSKFKVAISNIFSEQMDQDHIEEIRKFFDELDADKDGSITLVEFKDGMQNKFHTDLSEQQLSQMFSNIDTNDTRKFTFQELLTVTAHRMLVDEDERLYQAFQDLDNDGDGLISKNELEFAINRYEKKAYQLKNNTMMEPRASRYHTRNNSMMLKRFHDAFDVADGNNHGTIDYEKFLRMLHPEFAEHQDMSMDEFKSNVTESDRVRGSSWDVDYQSATASEYLDNRAKTPKMMARARSEGSKVAKSTGMPGPDALSLNSNFTTGSRESVENGAVSQMWAAKREEHDAAHKQEIEQLKQTNQSLEEKLTQLEKHSDDMRSKYEDETFVQLRQQMSELQTIKQQFEASHSSTEQMNDKFQQALKAKDEQIHEKDLLIANLNTLLDKRNAEMDVIQQKLQTMQKENERLHNTMQHAIDSKMSSLAHSQSEIQKLKSLLQNKYSRGNHVTD